MENAHDEQLDAGDVDIQQLLKEMEGAEAAAIGVERPLDRLISNLDELLHDLDSTGRELGQDKEDQSGTNSHGNN